MRLGNFFSDRSLHPPQMSVSSVHDAFIALHPLKLVASLPKRSAAPPEDEVPLEQLFDAMLAKVRENSSNRHLKATYLYAQLDPDRHSPPLLETREPQEIDAALHSLTTEFLEIVHEVLHEARYRRLTPQQIEEALQTASPLGMHLTIRFGIFRNLELYCRGDALATVTPWSFFPWRKSRSIDVTIYRRLILCYRLKQETSDSGEMLSTSKLHLRTFKNIPRNDIEMVLPGTQIRMSWKDHWKAGAPSFWGVGMLLLRIARAASMLALIGIVKMMATTVIALGVALGVLFYAVRSLFSYSNLKKRHLLQLTRNLYYQNLDNHAGTLLRLLDEADHQKASEAIVAYYLLDRSESPKTAHEIAQEAQTLLQDLLPGGTLQFEAEEALRHLAGLGIVASNADFWQPLDRRQSLNKLMMG
jgi:hypothetical protein